jgi:hypothetical protein
MKKNGNPKKAAINVNPWLTGSLKIVTLSRR